MVTLRSRYPVPELTDDETEIITRVFRESFSNHLFITGVNEYKVTLTPKE